MKKVRKIGNRRIDPPRAGKSPFTQSLNSFTIDDTAQRYLDALEHAEVLKKALLDACRQYGFTPKDAPKTKMLAGELYEVLASRATRTDVDRNKVGELKDWLYKRDRTLVVNCLFEAHEVLTVAANAEKVFAQPGLPRGLREHFERCLLKRTSRRLTVRKKKSAPARAARKAA